MIRTLAIVLVLFGLLFASCLRAQPVELEFIAAAPEFEDATSEYRSIWQREGDRIVEALRRYSGAQIPDHHVQVIVFEGTSNSGRVGGSLRLRASYAEPVKRATLSHELLHRYFAQVPGLRSCYPEVHDIMAVVLFELWSELWGHDFATEQARVEAARSERYRVSWSKALALSQAERKSEIAGIPSCRPPTMRSSGPRGEASMFPDVTSARGRLTRRWAAGVRESQALDASRAPRSSRPSSFGSIRRVVAQVQREASPRLRPEEQKGAARPIIRVSSPLSARASVVLRDRG